MGILKDHISIISFLKPGLVRVIDATSAEETYYVEDGIIEFKNNCLSILTSNIFDIKKIDKNKVRDILAKAENVLAIKEALVQYDPKTQFPFVEIETGEQSFERRDVKLGISDGINVEVLEGLSKDDKIKVWNQVKPVQGFSGRG